MARFRYTPHDAQRVIHAARDKRFRIVCCGRRFGKTRCIAAELLTRGLTEAPGNYAWIAPTYLIADRGIEAFRQIAPGHLDVRGRMPARITFTGKQGETAVWFLSAEQPDNIRSFGFVGMAIDEAAMIPRDVWLYVLRPTLADSKGWAVFISTPRGRNWFHDLFTRGRAPSTMSRPPP